MSKVTIDLTMSLDGFIAGPGDGREYPLGQGAGPRLFDWYQGGPPSAHGPLFAAKGVNAAVVDELFATTGCMLTGRRTYDITGGWKGSHPIPGLPVVVMTHKPPAEVPRGRSRFIFVSDGIEHAVAEARQATGEKNVGIGGASAAQQALRAGLVDELLLHVAPLVLGSGNRLFEHLATEVQLEPIGTVSSPEVTHLRYRVRR